MTSYFLTPFANVFALRAFQAKRNFYFRLPILSSISLLPLLHCRLGLRKFQFPFVFHPYCYLKGVVALLVAHSTKFPFYAFFLLVQQYIPPWHLLWKCAPKTVPCCFFQQFFSSWPGRRWQLHSCETYPVLQSRPSFIPHLCWPGLRDPVVLSISWWSILAVVVKMRQRLISFEHCGQKHYVGCFWLVCLKKILCLWPLFSPVILFRTQLELTVVI